MVLINYTRRKADKKEGGCYTPASEGQRPSEATHETLAQDVGFPKNPNCLWCFVAWRWRNSRPPSVERDTSPNSTRKARVCWLASLGGQTFPKHLGRRQRQESNERSRLKVSRYSCLTRKLPLLACAPDPLRALCARSISLRASKQPAGGSSSSGVRSSRNRTDAREPK